MIDIDWSKAPVDAESVEQNGYLLAWCKKGFWRDCDTGEWREKLAPSHWRTLSTRLQPEPRKTVKDAVKALNGTWSMDGYDFIGWNSNINRYVYGRNKWAGHEYLVCTREEFEEEAAKRKEEKQWTHLYHGQRCYLLTEKADGNDCLVIDVESAGYFVCELDEIKPIKSAISLSKALVIMINACPDEWSALLRKYDVKDFNIWTDDAAEEAA